MHADYYERLENIYLPGCWDLLHVGHTRIIKAAAQLGILYVGVASDKVVTLDKGQPPTIPQEHRLEMVNALGGVREAVLYDELEFVTHLEQFKINILVVGPFWGKEQRHIDAENWLKQKSYRSLVRLPYTKETSTTAIKQKIRAS
jgi:D-beta-D-heptose 7-phosphate kinase/D-beta-D-heptose 1-phosphate adenosyltransferase